ncbi:PREDICTED: odorant receptor Or2-like [Atta cephalotes]|uniref:Odorant receptor n=1 Tax=Atta cephalotes TaxID=12957 RepID=A0A158NSR7_ATTCE|nr:PREDICTED: odorant receptor Or2-like [Atta cephalotes]
MWRILPDKILSDIETILGETAQMRKDRLLIKSMENPPNGFGLDDRCHHTGKLDHLLIYRRVRPRPRGGENTSPHDTSIFAERINAVFTLMISVQFTISSTVLCLSIYKMLTKNLLSLEFAWSSSYLGCMLMQIYLYCWFGNEVTLKSTEIGNVIYEMEWPMLPVDLMKILLLIITRSKRPIKITSGYMITLSNDSFMKIIKISYSAYNVLQGS